MLPLARAVAALAPLAAVVAFGVPAGDAQSLPHRILFIGNSLTHGHYDPVRRYNNRSVIDDDFGLPPGNPRRETVDGETGPFGGIPGIFKKLTDEAGMGYEVHLETITGKTLEYQSVYGMIVIARPWNAVVVQDESTTPLPEARGGSLDRFLQYATAIEMKIHAVNPNAAAYLFETWPRADLTYRRHGSYVGEPIDAMDRDLHQAYYEEFVTDRHYQAVAPAGDAWVLAMQRGVARINPYDDTDRRGVNLWNVDGVHPSVYGAYLSACVLFQTITGSDIRALGDREAAARDLGIAPDIARALRSVAADQVADSDAAGR